MFIVIIDMKKAPFEKIKNYADEFEKQNVNPLVKIVVNWF
jgi:hypothetical protein